MAGSSRGLSGMAICTSRHPAATKYSAIETDETAIGVLSGGPNQVPISADWWVLKWGRSVTWADLALACMVAILRCALVRLISTVGPVIVSQLSVIRALQ